MVLVHVDFTLTAYLVKVIDKNWTTVFFFWFHHFSDGLGSMISFSSVLRKIRQFSKLHKSLFLLHTFLNKKSY